MKRTLILFVAGLTVAAVAQTTTPTAPTAPAPGAGTAVTPTPMTPTTPNQAIQPPSQVGPLNPVQNQRQFGSPPFLSRLSLTNVGFGSATLSNLFGNQTFTNQFGNQFSAAELSARLAEIEADIQATLPLLAAFNNQSDLRVAGTGTSAARNMASSQGTNFANRSSVNVARSTAVPTVPGTPLTPTGVPDPAGLRSGFATTDNLPITTSDTMRALLILQNDMERMLPILNAFNEGTTFGSEAATGGVGLTNRFDGQRTPGVDLNPATPR